MDWNTVYTGELWDIKQARHPSGKLFERAVRSPGSRLICIKDGSVLLSIEKRYELGGKTDYRLPGGKVFDSGAEYNAYLTSGADILEASRKSIAKEALEEVGLQVAPDHLIHVGTDVLGATCEWDLYYWVCTEFSLKQDGAQHSDTEADEIQGSVWMSFEEARNCALDPQSFSESRSARMLLTYLNGIQ